MTVKQEAFDRAMAAYDKALKQGAAHRERIRELEAEVAELKADNKWLKQRWTTATKDLMDAERKRVDYTDFKGVCEKAWREADERYKRFAELNPHYTDEAKKIRSVEIEMIVTIRDEAEKLWKRR